MILRGLLLGSFAVITMIIHAGVKKRTHFEQEKTFLVQNIKQDIASLRESEQAILATISSLDVDKYQTKRDKLLGEVHRLRTELEIKNGKLENEGLAGGQERTENDVMLSLRYMALLWNVVLAQLLAYLLRSKLNFSFSNS
ncbi:MAG: hypothetical protein KA436_10005 [Oligoflexales bacterium]|nr:hypothetical protein [Oligoflexales bacterium]